MLTEHGQEGHALKCIIWNTLRVHGRESIGVWGNRKVWPGRCGVEAGMLLQGTGRGELVYSRVTQSYPPTPPCVSGSHMLLPTAGNSGEQTRPKVTRVWEEAVYSDAPP